MDQLACFSSRALDPATDTGSSMLGMMSWAAEEEAKRIERRMVGTRKLLRDSGLYSEGLPPLGYARHAPKGTRHPDKNALVVVPEKAAVVRRVFALAIAGR